MKNYETFRTDVVIVGGGIAGLMTAEHLLRKGYAVTVTEKAPRIAAGATTRNEGWLHAGTYHGVAIQDPIDAAKVTERTQYGHAYISAYAPEAEEHRDLTTFALTQSTAFAEQAENRWSEFGVQRREVSTERLRTQIPEVALDPIAAVFEVDDRSINTRVLCEKLVRDITNQGGTILTDTRIQPIDEKSAELTIHGERMTIGADLFIMTAGAGIKEIVERHIGEPFPMRYWRSHLLVTPRLTKNSVFYLEPGEAGIMSHNGTSIVGINKDGIVQPDPNCEIDPEKEKLIFEAATRLVPDVANVGDIYTVTACVKPDILPKDKDNLNLKVNIGEPFPGWLYAVPGKMTESPYLAKELTSIVENRVSVKSHSVGRNFPSRSTNEKLPEITERPCDLYGYPTGVVTPIRGLPQITTS